MLAHPVPLLYHQRLDLITGLFPLGLPQNFVCISYIAHLIYLDLVTLITSIEKCKLPDSVLRNYSLAVFRSFLIS